MSLTSLAFGFALVLGCRGTTRCPEDQRFDERGVCVSISTCPSGRDPQTGVCTGGPDGGGMDASAGDAATGDGGSVDAGGEDAGGEDAGFQDAASGDSGTIDGGGRDASAGDDAAVDTCGDGALDLGEDCDDGDLDPMDGCGPGCSIEPGWSCTGEPSSCAEDCGDSMVVGDEECDDGNVANADGCSSACVVEPGFSCSGEPSSCSADPPGSSGELVIAEIMANPSAVSDSAGEWVEIYNPTSVTYDLNGCDLRDDFGAWTVGMELLVAPGDRITVAASASPGFGPDAVWSGISLGNDDRVSVFCGGTVIDEVDYEGSGFLVVSGESLSLDPTMLDATSNDSGSNWCAPTSSYGSGDLSTPGGPNDSC